MAPAYSRDLAWRVVMRVTWFGQDVSQICHPEDGLGVSRHFVSDVMRRFDATGDVATYQGQGADPMERRALSRADSWHIIHLLISSPRTTLKDQRAQFVLDTGVRISYRAFCSAVNQLGYTRKKVRSNPPQCHLAM